MAAAGACSWVNKSSHFTIRGAALPKGRGGYLYANEKPGWGIEINEKAAAKFPFSGGGGARNNNSKGGWGEIRKRDGTITKQ